MPRWNTVEARERNHVGERHPSPCLSVEVTTCFSGGRRHTISKALALFGVPRDRIALEPDSETTRANAENTARLLKERGIETTVLVTSALHMRRAAAEFGRAECT